MTNKDIFCVVRSVGERTADLCVKQWTQEGIADIEVVQNKKSKDGIRLCYESAINSNKELLLTKIKEGN